MSPRQPTLSSEEPRSEPEIIPPLRENARGDTMWASVDDRGTQRIYVARLAPLSVAVLLLGIALLAAVLLVLLIGTFLIWIPVVTLLIATAVISAWWQQTFRR